MDVDPRFRRSGRHSQRRNLRRRLRRIAGAGTAGLILIALGLWWMRGGGPEEIAFADGQIVQVESATATAPPIRVATPFVDLAGDPMILRFDTGANDRSVSLAGPPTLDAARFGTPAPDRLVLVRDELVVREKQLMTALPSSREDFAFFQATRSLSQAPPPARATEAPPPETAAQEPSDGQSWGAPIAGTAAGEADLTYTETAISNTTSIAYVKPEAARLPVFRDVVLRIAAARSLPEILVSNGLSDAAATAFAEQAATLIPALAEMAPGSILALRLRPGPAAPEVLQLALYGADGYIGSLARQAPGRYVPGADPWIDDDLPALAAAQAGEDQGALVQNFRLLDAFYSAAIRNGVPTALVGEAIVLMSRAHDLEAIATPGDRMTLLYAPIPGSAGQGPSQILYAAISGPSGDKACYIAENNGEFACFGANGRAAATGALGRGLITPVKGAALTSGFGPRFHPILKAVRMHSGVDWAAPVGTPVTAAAAGTVTQAGDGGAYGNVIYIDHPDGTQTRYAHLDGFAEGIRAGVAVRTGDLIGYVGNTGRSTGPHLHFEVHVAGAAVDPFTLGGGLGASDAVEALTNRIIQVESGGDATAKNPLSTATGLGQFIEGTWLRMMRDYRPDLVANMTRADLLALRTDPTISREMVQNLARENESYLRARGHDISAGRLYLAHFVGSEGAHVVLSSGEGQTVLEVMGQAVVSANPFLTNYTIGDLKAWADAKMSGAGGSGMPAVIAVPPAVRAYMTVIDEILAEQTQAETPAPAAEDEAVASP